MRAVMNGVMYILSTGCQWRYIPKDFPPRSTLHDYFTWWIRSLPRRWIVQRTIAWLNRYRRLAKDWENLNRNALAFLKLASIRLMLRKPSNP
jgi:transposase